MIFLWFWYPKLWHTWPGYPVKSIWLPELIQILQSMLDPYDQLDPDIRLKVYGCWNWSRSFKACWIRIQVLTNWIRISGWEYMVPGTDPDPSKHAGSVSKLWTTGPGYPVKIICILELIQILQSMLDPYPKLWPTWSGYPVKSLWLWLRGPLKVLVRFIH